MVSGEPCFLDATVLSNFASTDSIEWLVELIECPAIVPAVRTELDAGREFGYEYLNDALEAIETGIEVVEFPETSDRRKLRERLDSGEADSVLAAIEYGGVLASDDLAARRVAREYDVRVTGSVGMLALGIERGVLDVDSADRWLDTWRTERSYYSPVEGISEILEE